MCRGHPDQRGVHGTIYDVRHLQQSSCQNPEVYESLKAFGIKLEWGPCMLMEFGAHLSPLFSPTLNSKRAF